MKNKRIFLSPPHMGGEELKFIEEAFKSNYIAPLGPMIDAFEREFAEKAGIPHVVALSSGTAAVHLALKHLLGNAERGTRNAEEAPLVVASSLTFIGGVSPVTFLGAEPVFIDSDKDTWNMDPDLLAEELEECRKKGKMPRVVVPTDIYGQCVDLNRILEICEPYGIPVVADSAEAVGSLYRRAIQRNAERGTRNAECEERTSNIQHRTSNIEGGIDHYRSEFGMVHAGVGAKAAVYSFNGNKIITTSGGGMLASDDKELIDHARFLSTQARDKAPHYEHSEIGYNYRMSSIAAAIGRGQLRVLDDRVKARRRIFETYKELLKDVPGIEFMPEASYGRSNRWLTVIMITPEEFGADRETVRKALEAKNIEARPVWKPMHMQPVFRNCGFRSADCGLEENRIETQTCRNNVISEDLFARGLCLPSGTAMTDDDIERVVDIIRRTRRK